jgi:hypothetical protein
MEFHYATSRKVADSILDKVTEFLNWPDPFLGSTQPLTEMSTRNLLGVKGGRRVTQPHRHLWVDCLENMGVSTSHNLMGQHGVLQG